MTNPGSLAVQYLRMSTDQQQYSFHNQSAAIAEYAQTHGFNIVRSYYDAAKSGVVLKHREGLRALLQDVVRRQSDFKVVLVYDISRWGRFQDTDESAHYEFICRSAGVSIHYCAEPFENDGSPASTILKTLKRSMAAEFSRELGVQVYAGKRTLSEVGFNVGGRVPFGFRRKIVSHDALRGRVLEIGDRKNVRTERLTLVHGPAEEIECVREIFRCVLSEHKSPGEIAKDLNFRGLFQRGRRWTQFRVTVILSNPVYCGTCTWGRTSRRLGKELIKLDPSQWVLKAAAFPSVVSESDFKRAQTLFQPSPGRIFWTRERILSSATKLFERNGKLSCKLFDGAMDAPSSNTLRKVGDFSRLCEYVGYSPPPSYLARSKSIRETFRLYQQVAAELASASPDRISILPGHRPRLLVDGEIVISLLGCRSVVWPSRSVRWVVRPVASEANNVSVLCRLNRTNTGLEGLFVFPEIRLARKTHFFADHDAWFAKGRRLVRFSQLCDLACLAVSESQSSRGRSPRRFGADA